jgi:flagellar export protein FliJ
MARDPLQAVLKLRELAVEEARRDVAACLELETAAGREAAAAEQAIGRETAAATDLSAGDAEVESFAAWLPHGRRRAREAHEKHEAAAMDTARARAVLAASRAGVEAVQKLIEKRRAEENAALARKAQAELDEAGLRRRTGITDP